MSIAYTANYKELFILQLADGYQQCPVARHFLLYVCLHVYQFTGLNCRRLLVWNRLTDDIIRQVKLDDFEICGSVFDSYGHPF